MTTFNTDLNDARQYDDAPERPERLFVESQLQTALQALAPEGVTVEVNTRFRSTYARLNKDGEDVLEVSWDLFQDEEHYEDSGWRTVCFAARDLLEKSGYDGGDF